MTTRDPKRWAALAYAVGLISGVIVLSLEKKDSYVRFHAWQSVLVFTVAAGFSMLVPTVPVIGDWGLTRMLFRISVITLYVFLIVKALNGDRHKLPLLGDLASKLASE